MNSTNNSPITERHRRATSAATVTLFAAALLMTACGGGGDSPQRVESLGTHNEQWTLAAPGEVGMDAATLQLALNDESFRSSIIVQRHGKPVLEHYWKGYDKNTLHEIRSATKSITSLMTGIAIDKGVLKGVDQPISELLGAAYPGRPALTRNITVGHLLTMSSGLDCDDFDESSPGHQKNMYPTRDWPDFILNLSQRSTPGTQARYCTGGVTTLGRAISEASKLSVPAFAEQHLLAPLNITTMKWVTYDNGKHSSAGGLASLRPRDMLKIGQLVLQKGKWEGRQIVSEEWIAESTRSHVALFPARNRYGYLWWFGTVPLGNRLLQVHYASGNGGQYIFVIPELDMVVVFTGQNFNANTDTSTFQILTQYIVGAVK
ncbi:serine hydrolase domain-containing protein [Massilia glaciei]|nr:serine hydrolase [Massilia glaciei]